MIVEDGHAPRLRCATLEVFDANELTRLWWHGPAARGVGAEEEVDQRKGLSVERHPIHGLTAEVAKDETTGHALDAEDVTSWGCGVAAREEGDREQGEPNSRRAS
jgi:hypothetical protein